MRICPRIESAIVVVFSCLAMYGGGVFGQEVPGASQGAFPTYDNLTGTYRLTFSLEKSEKPGVYWKFLSRINGLDANGVRMESLSNVVIADNTAYFAAAGDVCSVFAVNAADGSMVWQYEHVVRRPNGTPSVDAEHVYFGSSTGVTALDRKHGSLVWHLPIPGGFGEGQPLPVDGRVFLSGYDGLSYCVDCKTGRVIWTHNLVENAPEVRPRVAGQQARFGNKLARSRGSACNGEVFLQSVFDQSRLIAISCDTGERLWAFQANGWIGPAPTIVGGRVYICSQDKHLYCLDLTTGDLLWEFESPTWNASRVAVQEGVVFLPVHRGRMFLLNASTGKLLSAFDPSSQNKKYGLVYTFPIVSGNAALYATGDGFLLNLDPQSKRLHWEMQPSPPSELFADPVTDGTKIYVSSRQNGETGGECAIIALGFGEPRDAKLWSADDSTGRVLDDIALLQSVQGNGPKGYLFYVAALGQFTTVFPMANPSWDVEDQLRAARKAAEPKFDAMIEDLVDIVDLQDGQVEQFRIADGRGYQRQLHAVRELNTQLATISHKEHASPQTEEDYQQRLRRLDESISTLEPFAVGTATYEAVPTILDAVQLGKLETHIAAQSPNVFYVLGLDESQQTKFRSLLARRLHNPLALDESRLLSVLKRNWRDLQAQIESILNHSQLEMCRLIMRD